MRSGGRPGRLNEEGDGEMDDYDGVIFYKEAIAELIQETDDLDLLDLVYKVLIESKKVSIL